MGAARRSHRLAPPPQTQSVNEHVGREATQGAVVSARPELEVALADQRLIGRAFRLSAYLHRVDSLQPRLRFEPLKRLACFSAERFGLVAPALGGKPLGVLDLRGGVVEGETVLGEDLLGPRVIAESGIRGGFRRRFVGTTISASAEGLGKNHDSIALKKPSLGPCAGPRRRLPECATPAAPRGRESSAARG